MKEDYIKELGKEDGTAYYYFVYEVLRINILWSEFKLLYTSGDKPIEILNNTAPTFFHFLRESIFRDVVLSLTRITELEGRGNNRNLSLDTILNILSNKINKGELKQDLDIIGKSRLVLKKFRDKQYSHNSYKLIVAKTINIDSIDKNLINETVESLNICYKKTHEQLFNKGIILNTLLKNESMELLRKLERAKRYESMYFREMEKMNDFDSDFYIKDLKFDK